MTERQKPQQATAEDRPQNAPGASPRDYDPMEGWIPWEKRFSTSTPCKVWPGGKMKTEEGKPIPPILVPVGEKPFHRTEKVLPVMKTKAERKRLYDERTKFAEGKWTNETVHAIRSDE